MSVSNNDLMAAAAADTVSSGDSVSGGDFGAYTTAADTTAIIEPLEFINYNLALIAFLIIFVFCEQKITSGVRRLLKHE